MKRVISLITVLLIFFLGLNSSNIQVKAEEIPPLVIQYLCPISQQEPFKWVQTYIVFSQEKTDSSKVAKVFELKESDIAYVPPEGPPELAKAEELKTIFSAYENENKILPQVWKITVPVNGTLLPGNSRFYGPYSGYIYLAISLSWAPADQVVQVGYSYTDGSGGGWWNLFGGSGTAGFNLDWTKSFNVYIWNPSPPNTKTINFNGTITLFFQ